MNAMTLNKSVIQVDELDSADESGRRYWRAQSHADRLEAVEFQRQQLFAYDPTTARLQRVLSITERA